MRIHAIKWHVVTHYTLDEIRTKKLYDRRTVSKKEILDNMFEYRYPDSGKDTRHT